ncbi:MAG: putative Zn-dependent peptidase, partial [Roseivirga sp.]
FSCVGNIPLKKIEKLAEKYFAQIPHHVGERFRLTFDKYTPNSETIFRNITQAHCAIGTTAYELSHANRLPFFMLINVLGGPGMNSRLNLALREKYGFVYSIDAGYHPFSDTGLFSIFFGTEKTQVERGRKLVLKELQKLREVPLGTLQLHMAKEQIIGQLAMAEENNTSLMLMMGKSILDTERIDGLESIYDRLRKVTSNELLEIANDMLNESQLSHLTFLPEN